MNSIDSLKLLTGVDIPKPLLKLTFHQPRLKEIALIGEEKYLQLLSILGTNVLEVSKQSGVSEFQIFNEILEQVSKEHTRADFQNFFKIFIPEYRTKLTKISIAFLPKEGSAIEINEATWPAFKNTILSIGCLDLLTGKKDELKAGNKEAAEIMEKMAKAQAKIDKIKNKNNKKTTILQTYILVIAIITANSFEDIGNMTLYQLITTAKTALAKESYATEVSARLAGADSKTELKHWLEAEM